MIKADIVALLRTIAGMGAKVHWDLAPQDEPAPYIVCTRIFGDPVNNLDGADGMKLTRIQADCWDETPKAAEDLLELVNAKFDTWATGGATATPAAANVHGCVRLGENPDDYDPVTKHHKASADFSVHHE
ncbi:MAG: DUF3168 domain-containing protein [Phycisphaerales bacterium]|nr:DUF3168 domain-containing protein [Phycisphaerales bacterium]